MVLNNKIKIKTINNINLDEIRRTICVQYIKDCNIVDRKF